VSGFSLTPSDPGAARHGPTGRLAEVSRHRHACCMRVAVIEREEWLLVMGILGDIREELKKLNALLGGDDDGPEEEEEGR
jgi:hypothetical protein